MKKLLLAAAALTCAGAAVAGPNVGGTLIVHENPGVVASSDPTDYCGSSGLQDCGAAITRHDGTESAALFVLAAFPGGSSPRLSGVVFGVGYPADITLLYGTACGDFELATAGWPASGEGTAVTWNSAQTGLLTEVYSFVGYTYYGAPAVLALTAHPSQGSSFADDSVPSQLDDIACLSSFGFNTAGSLCCPGVVIRTGACCLPDYTCQVLTADECVLAGGDYKGDDVPCAADTCPPPPVYGSCCMGEVCSITTQADCGGGTWTQDGVCDPNPCLPPVPTQNSTWGAVKSVFGN